jgi:hypothetical protein
MSLHELLEELKVANDVVQDVKQAEVQANTAILLDQASSATIGSFPGSLIFVNIRQQSFWGPAKGGEEEGTQLRGIWSVTNVSDRDHYILDARLDEHRTNYVVFSIEDPTTGLHSAKHVIRPKSTTELAANFFFFPPIISESVPLVADVVFTDNFGRQHLVRSEFHPVGRPS